MVVTDLNAEQLVKCSNPDAVCTTRYGIHFILSADFGGPLGWVSNDHDESDAWHDAAVNLDLI